MNGPVTLLPERPCRHCVGGGLICSAVEDHAMRCPAPVYDDEFDLLGVCPHLVPCPTCDGKGVCDASRTPA